MSLSLNPELEARLIQLANANGTSLDSFVTQLIARNELVEPQTRSPEEWVTEFESWADSFPQTRSTPLSEDALSRESLNPDRV